MRYPAALAIVRERVKPQRDADPVYENIWWQLWRPRPELRRATAALGRFIAGNRLGKRMFFVWCNPDWRPSDQTITFALDSDYAIGVLTSRIHTGWAAARCSTLEDRIRYTPSSAFETFPWPQPSPEESDQIAAACREVLDMRSALCREHEIGLTTLYNRVDDGAFVELRDKHQALDLAVIAAYGWSASLLTDVRSRNQALYELNRAIVAGEWAYEPF